MGIRYDNRKIRTNRTQASKEARDRRGLKRVQQYTTPRFPEISPSDYASISSQQHEWTYGDRYYKLAAKYYGDSEMWWVIAWFNQAPTESHLVIGDTIEVPISIEQALSVFYRGA